MSKLDKYSHNKAKISLNNRDDIFSWKEDLNKILLSVQEQHPHIVIIWDGDIWDKAKWFIDKTDKIHEAGFKTTKKIMLWSDISSQSETDKNFLNILSHAISTYYKDMPVLIVRSSGQGDAIWVWIYSSNFVKNTPADIAVAIDKIHASNRSISAVEYRRILWISTAEMWICIEPCIGNLYTPHDNYSYFGPDLSWRWGKDELWVQELGVYPWIWWWVTNRNYTHIESEYHKRSLLSDFIPINWEIPSNFTIGGVFSSHYPVSLFVWNRLVKTRGFSSDSAPIYRIESNEIFDVPLIWKQKENISNYPLWNVLTSIRALEKNLKSPQYFEWAAVNTWWKFDTYITQIADQIHDSLSVNLQQKWNCILETKDLVRSWMRDFDKVLLIKWNDATASSYYIQKLFEYNKNNKNYLLLVSDKITYGSLNLPFENFSNAGWIIEIPSVLWHLSSPSSHYKWLLSATNILFWVLAVMSQSAFKNIKSRSVDKHNLLKEFTQNKFRLVQDAKKWVWKLFLLK